MIVVLVVASTFAQPGSQLEQDEWIIQQFKHKRNGYFVDVGAHNGIELSNSLLLERDYGWKGICIESNPRTFDALKRQRACACSNVTVGGGTEEVEFCDAAMAEYGGIVGLRPFGGAECVAVRRVRTTALADVLDMHGAPDVIDYLSIDIEGAELVTLRAFPFDRYRFRRLTVEHNEPHEASGAVPAGYRKAIRVLLESHGYEYVRGNADVLGQGFGPIEDFYRWKGSNASIQVHAGPGGGRKKQRDRRRTEL